MRRRVEKSLFTDPVFVQLNAGERLLFIGMLLHQDGANRIIGSPRALRELIFPFDMKVTDAIVQAWRDGLLAKDPSIQMYVEDGAIERIFIGAPGQVMPVMSAPMLEALTILRSIPGYPIIGKQDAVLLNELQQEYPGVDPVERVRRFKAWCLDNPPKNARLALRNWFMKGAQFEAERKALLPPALLGSALSGAEDYEDYEARQREERKKRGLPLGPGDA